MTGITNEYIEYLMQHFDLAFKGVFSSDDIPFYSEHNISFICNLSKKFEKGTHL
jgi:hypothetical protein